MKFLFLCSTLLFLFSCSNNKVEIVERQKVLKSEMEALSDSALLIIELQQKIGKPPRIDNIPLDLPEPELQRKATEIRKQAIANKDSASKLDPLLNRIKRDLDVRKNEYDSLDFELKKY